MNIFNNIDDYLAHTESAVKETFKLLKQYNSLLDSVPKGLWLLSEKQLKNPNKIVRRRILIEDEYIFNLYSQNSIAGLIFHFAYIAISIFSKSKPNNKGCFEILNQKPNPEIKKFFVGRTIEEPPNSGSKIKPIQIGLIIYATRNQWAHHNENKDTIKDKIFSILVSRTSIYSNNSYFHPAFDTKSNEQRILATNVLDLLGWKDYKSYKLDMLDISKSFM